MTIIEERDHNTEICILKLEHKVSIIKEWILLPRKEAIKFITISEPLFPNGIFFTYGPNISDRENMEMLIDEDRSHIAAFKLLFPSGHMGVTAYHHLMDSYNKKECDACGATENLKWVGCWVCEDDDKCDC